MVQTRDQPPSDSTCEATYRYLLGHLWSDNRDQFIKTCPILASVPPAQGRVEPCLPSKVDRPPWVYEIKHGGYWLRVRCLTRRGGSCALVCPAIGLFSSEKISPRGMQ